MNKRFDQAAKVFALRAEGYSLKEIAHQMNRTVRWVRKMLSYYTETAQNQLNETREEARQLIVERIHQLIQPHMQRKEDPESAKIVLQATKLEADVLGLHEQPVRDQTAREIIRALADQFQMFRRFEPIKEPPALSEPEAAEPIDADYVVEETVLSLNESGEPPWNEP